MNPKIQEEIKLKTELLKGLFLILLAVGTAVANLLKNQTGKPMELVFIILGFFCIFVLLVSIILLYAKIKSIIRKS
jgi:hypothetical protein